jgi:ParB family chromosome partitioning protein
MSESRAIASIIVGVRHRKDMGDVGGLAASIKEVGLLHPPVITPTGHLIAGERRLRAVQSLGWNEVPVRVIDVSAVVRGELAENSFRKDFVPSEMVAIAAAVEMEEQAQARKRMIAAHASPAESAEQAKGETRQKVAARIGTSHDTLAKAKQIVAAADAEPGKVRQVGRGHG